MTTRTPPGTRERILDAACDVIAAQGIEDVRIARVATVAGVSPALVHYHFATREALLGEALEHSFELLGDIRTTRAEDEDWTAAQRLGWMIDQSMPFRGLARARVAAVARAVGEGARQPSLRPVAARLYERYDAWIAEVIQEGIDKGEFHARDAYVVTQRLIAAIEGHGFRVLVNDPAMPSTRARRLIVGALADELGVGIDAFDPIGEI
jgi:AcrR family transcriptional regulator